MAWYGIYWWPLDFISGEKPWLDDDGQPVRFISRRDANAYMHRLYLDPDYRKLGFRVGLI